AADLAAAGFGDLSGNAVKLGKALQDPIKYTGALARTGVTFTAAQKEQIAALQKSGDLLGAQKLVLGQIEQRVGGTAEATATASQKMATAFGETQEQLGGKLLPVVNLVAGAFTKYSNILIPLAGVIIAIVVASKLFTAVTTVMTGVTKAAAAAQWLWN